MKPSQCSIRDIATEAGVDPSTVSRALKGSARVAASTRATILALAREMNYTPNLMAQALKGQGTQTVGILVPSLELPFFVDLLRAQERWLYRNGYAAVVSVLHGAPGREQTEIIARMQSRAVEGVCVGFPEADTVDAYAALAAAGIPMSAYCEKSYLHQVDSVPMDVAVCDLSRGVSLLAQHLSELGHRRIAFVGYLPVRHNEFQQAMQENGLPVSLELVLSPRNDSAEAVAEACSKLLELTPRPTAVIVQSDEMAVRLLKELGAAGIGVPHDMSVVGINNNPVGEFVQPSLTTLALPTQPIGEWMAAAVVRRIKERALTPETRYFPTDVAVRGSSAPPTSL